MNLENKMFYLHFWVDYSNKIFSDGNYDTIYEYIGYNTDTNTNITFLHYCSITCYKDFKTVKKFFEEDIKWIFKNYYLVPKTPKNPAIPAIPEKPYIVSTNRFNEIFNA